MFLKYYNKEIFKDFIKELKLLPEFYPIDKQIKILYSISNNPKRYYIVHTISKKDGTKRILREPNYLLKCIQHNILKNILDKQQISDNAHAYQKGKSIITNALPHLKNPIVVKLDIKDFFDNINFMMVKNFIFKSIYYPDDIAYLLTSLCIYFDLLPQGAPTSAAISNIIMKKFDDDISSWCMKNNITYTRYSDDMTFSGDINSAIIINEVKNLLYKYGFILNYKKIKILKNNNQKKITGIVVNEKLQVDKNYRNNLRKKIYYIEKYGLDNHLKYNKITINNKKYLCSLIGKINYVLSVNENDLYFKNKLKIIKEMLSKIA